MGTGLKKHERGLVESFKKKRRGGWGEGGFQLGVFRGNDQKKMRKLTAFRAAQIALGWVVANVAVGAEARSSSECLLAGGSLALINARLEGLILSSHQGARKNTVPCGCNGSAGERSGEDQS